MIAFLAAAAFASASQAPIADIPAKFFAPKPEGAAAVAKVDGVPITASEVERLVWDWRAYEAMQDLVTYRMLLAEGARLGVRVQDADVEKALADQLKQSAASGAPGSNPEQTLYEQGFPKSRLFLRVKSQLLLEGIAAMEFNPAHFVEVSTIIVKPKSEQASDLAAAIQQAQKAYDDLKAGAKWDAVLKRFQSEPEVLRNHGRVGWRPYSAFPESVRKELQTLAEGAITNPAQTGNGIQIFRVDRQGKGVQGEVLGELKRQYLESSRQQALDRIRKAAKVEDLLPRAG